MVRLLVVFSGHVYEERVSDDSTFAYIRGVELWGGQVIGLEKIIL